MNSNKPIGGVGKDMIVMFGFQHNSKSKNHTTNVYLIKLTKYISVAKAARNQHIFLILSIASTIQTEN